MNKDQIKRTVLCFLPLVFAIAGILFMFGNTLSYTIKYVPDGAQEAIKETFSLNLVSLFSTSVGLPWVYALILISISLGGILPLFCLLKKDKINDYFVYGSVITSLIAICFLFMSKEIYCSTVAYSIENFKSAELGWGSAVAILCSTISVFSVLALINEKIGLNTKSIAEDALLIAAAFVLNFIKVPLAATGGSVNLQLLPLFIIALRRGPAHAFVTSGLIYGLLTCLTDGYGFATYPFDYIIGFGSAGIVGLFNVILNNEEKPLWYRYIFVVIAVIASTCVRFIGGMVSSMVIYQYDFIAAAEYNAPYIFLSGLAALAGFLVLYPTIVKLNKVFPVKNK